jgi:[ribosomal protein S18]-alanine N-acetyltransferase
VSDQLQLAVVADAPELAEIHRTAFLPAEAWGEDAISLQLALPGVFGLWQPRAGMLLGRVAADQAEVLTLAVDPLARRQGIATALLEAASAWATSRTATAIFLEVSTVNLPARALYARCGFREVGRRQRYYNDGSDALVLSRQLMASPPG